MSQRIIANPFTPGLPVTSQRFVGRSETVAEVLTHVKQASQGRFAGILLLGERGVGKTSLARYVSREAESSFGLSPIHVSLLGARNNGAFVRRLFEEMLKRLIEWGHRARHDDFLPGSLERTNAFGLPFLFCPEGDELEHLAWRLPEAIERFLECMGESGHGLLVVLDDMDQLAESEDFAGSCKNLVEHVSTRSDRFPVAMMLVARPQVVPRLTKSEPSLREVLKIVRIPATLHGRDVLMFLKNRLSEIEVVADNETVDVFVEFSEGLPILMHEVGDAVFRTGDALISDKAARAILMDAAEAIGCKCAHPELCDVANKFARKRILANLKGKWAEAFTRQDLESGLDVDGKNDLGTLLDKMMGLGLIVTDNTKPSSAYVFANEGCYSNFILWWTARTNAHELRVK